MRSRDAPTYEKPTAAAWWVFALFALGFFVSYVYRSVNVAFEPLLRETFGLNASQLGLLTAFYFLGFAAVQPLVGQLLDRIGPRRTEAGLFTLTVAGGLTFAAADGLTWLIAGRLLIGIGLAACLTAAYQAIATWFPVERLPLLNGVMFALGSFGAVVVGTPLDMLLAHFGWREIMYGLAALTVVVALLIGFTAPERRGKGGHASAPAARPPLRGYLADPRFWSTLPLTTLNQGIFLALQTLWMVPFLRDFSGIEGRGAANLVSIVGLALIVGCISLGWLATRLVRAGVPVSLTSGAAMSVFPLVQGLLLWAPNLPPELLWALFGYFGSAGIMLYGYMSAQFPLTVLGRVNTTVTLSVFLGTFFFQVAIGWLLELFGGNSAWAHEMVWTVLIALQAAAVLLFWVANGARRRAAANEPQGQP